MATITLISGSTMGSAEYVAEHMAEILEDAGFSTKMLHGPSLDELPQEGIWLVVTSTHGAGELPENIQPLAAEISDQKPDFSKVTFGAVGLGSSEYDTFCGAIRSFDQLLIENGAKRLGDRLEIDIQQHEIPEDPAEEWVKNWANSL
ncbi:FMN-binding protein MioC [Photorhabdus bodei]|uniref:FMN-binding protein MioC n=1 Tax=Photorhabdus bodei TaxID=2029681 RepID=A0ABX0AX35_9GAMM|nr:FMN-binding protein MioC [Photorhabdus bodei]NDK99389.1 FMN-binding protein MioC [Photorhabdus bodei]NDL05144.1 FMN-binding protein MioC [Photorhabdus bodei]NDL09448.1 FMN-binding protein MioC [Photorhabdus bodei]